jgi:hypothetical protein
MRLALSTLLFPVLLTACASSVLRGPAPMVDVPVQTWTENSVDQGAVQIFMRNDSKVDHIITQLQVFNCLNVRQECKTYTPNLLVPAGKIITAMRLSRESLTQEWKYQYTFRTRAASAPATTVVPSSPGAIRMVELKDPEQFVPRAKGSAGEGHCNVPPPATQPTGPSMLIMTFPTTDLEHRRTIFLDLDAEGRPVRYSDNRGNLGIRGDVPGIDTLAAKTTIQIDIGQHVAILVNQGGNQPSEFFRSAGAQVMTATALDNPRAMIDRIVKECGAR